jgi:hypothetical protein
LENGLCQNGYGTQSPAGYSIAACFIAAIIWKYVFEEK